LLDRLRSPQQDPRLSLGSTLAFGQRLLFRGAGSN